MNKIFFSTKQTVLKQNHVKERIPVLYCNKFLALFNYL